MKINKNEIVGYILTVYGIYIIYNNGFWDSVTHVLMLILPFTLGLFMLATEDTPVKKLRLHIAKTGIPNWVGWVINILSWILFISTFNHVIEIIMGLFCCFAFYIGYKNKNNSLMYSSGFDAAWMFAWGIGLFGEFKL